MQLDAQLAPDQRGDALQGRAVHFLCGVYVYQIDNVLMIVIWYTNN
jgi:hypothetical protein